ncbi:MAG: SDR family NAD(P)-dependent oxidoreductase [Bernardetiaceae bacterium]|nr:SDR family NAD(P)-dependent oxidoreductase [Bernardetiaceae bacterium]
MSKSNWNADQIPDLKGKVVIITGATSGLGKEATKVLAQKNATVIMAVRNTKKGKVVAQEIKNTTLQAKIDIKAMDLSSLESVKCFAKDVLSSYKHLDVLINNAGIMACPYDKTKDDFEIQMGTNHLGHFALTGLLMPLLEQTKNARIVATSSLGHRVGNINFDDINWEKRKYNSSQAYADSKLANLYFAYHLAEKLKAKNKDIKVTAAHPGWTRTDLQKHSWYMRMLNPLFSQGTDQGVLPTLRAAFDEKAQSGDYYGPSRFFEMHGSPIVVKSNARSLDKTMAKKLWDISESLTKIKY